ncbi:hypothetical protein [Hyphobacterium sp.]|uniref:hypothetical protein n=1 Tax=Hyphobacterium sp. TaxID=2004662 RepID=UPI003BAC07FB
MTKNFVAALTASVFWAIVANAQEADERTADSQMSAAINAWQESLSLWTDGRYLDSLEVLDVVDPVPESMQYSLDQAEGTIRAFVGDEAGAIEAFTRHLDVDVEPFDRASLNEPLAAADALDTLRHMARDYRVVMINEAHNVSRHRAFTAELLTALHADGFTAFAAEGFHEQTGSRMAEVGHPRHDQSAYIQDPFYAEMLRAAHALGMTIVGYEERAEQSCRPDCTTAENSANREINQAQNLAAFVEANPDARILVHVGYAHLSELVFEDLAHMKMGAHFTRLTGLDPLTIDQFRATPGVWPPHESALTFLYENYPINAPTIYFDAENEPYRIIDYADLTVIHPVLPDNDGRPGWIANSGYFERHPFNIDPSWLPETRPIVVMAHIAGEPDGAIAMDQLLVESDTGLPVTLMLPEGDYHLSIQTLDDPDIELGVYSAVSGEALVPIGQSETDQESWANEGPP